MQLEAYFPQIGGENEIIVWKNNIRAIPDILNYRGGGEEGLLSGDQLEPLLFSVNVPRLFYKHDPFLMK